MKGAIEAAGLTGGWTEPDGWYLVMPVLTDGDGCVPHVFASCSAPDLRALLESDAPARIYEAWETFLAVCEDVKAGN
jgi:hypothetical protein